MRVDEWYLPWNRAEGYVCERCSKCNYTVLLSYLTNNILMIILRYTLLWVVGSIRLPVGNQYNKYYCCLAALICYYNIKTWPDQSHVHIFES